MKIAFISYEYPPDTAYGGIATYVHQAARMLRERGHHVEVFAGSPYRTGTEVQDGLLIHRVKENDQQQFSRPIGQIFAERHATVQFDVLEGPEFSADAREAVKLVPEIPLVIKLHTPSIFLLKFNYYEYPLLKKTLLALRALRSGRKPSWSYDLASKAERAYALKADEVERAHALEADEIATPSTSLGNQLTKQWGLDASKVSHVPYPYIPSKRLLDIPAETKTDTVTFLGRLEMRKGVLDLAGAIPLIVRRHPNVRFRFVGSAEPSSKPNMDMRQYLARALQNYSESIEFTGAVAFDRVPDVLATTDICVFPSIWENFPCVCLEAMAAARGVVGSSAGGMVDMLDKMGKLVPPRSPKKIAEAVIMLLDDPKMRMKLGKAARDRLLRTYGADHIGALQEASYARAIARRRALGARFE